MTRIRIAAAALATTLIAVSGCDAATHATHATTNNAVQRLNQVLQSVVVAHPWVPGVLANVSTDPNRTGYSLNWSGARGISDLATNAPMQSNSAYVMASVTKTYVAATTLKLEEFRLLKLTDTLDSRLRVKTLNVLRAAGYDTSRITIDMLLAHTAGLRDYISAEFFAAIAADPTKHWTRLEEVAFAMSLGSPLSAPGTTYQYVDTDYILLGEIIENQTSLPLPLAVRTFLDFAGLGLNATVWQAGDVVMATGAAPLSHPYISFVTTDGSVLDFLDLDPSVDLYGGGGLTTITADGTKFIRALIDGQVLSPASLQKLKTLGPGGYDPDVLGKYGRGLTKFNVNGAVCWGHIGAWGSMSISCPVIGVSLAFTINSNGDPAGIDAFNQLDLARALVTAATAPN